MTSRARSSGTGLQQRHFGGGRCAYFQHHLGAKCVSGGANLRTGGGIGIVSNAGSNTRTTLHDHGMVRRDQFLDGLGGRCNAGFTLPRLGWNADFHELLQIEGLFCYFEFARKHLADNFLLLTVSAISPHNAAKTKAKTRIKTKVLDFACFSLIRQ